MDVDVSEINRLAADLGRVGPKVVDAAGAVITKGALAIKNNARAAISGLAHAPLYPASISYDLHFRPGVAGATIEAEIGPDKGRPQGPLGNILEYGTSKNPPLAHLGPSLDREAPNVEHHLADAAVKALPL